MFLKKLSLVNFRNIAKEEIYFVSSTTILTGGNGQGKTNFLEAIYFLSALRSFRTSRQSSLKMEGAKNTALKGETITDNGVNEELELYWDESRREQRYLGKEVSPTEFVGKLQAISFTPDDIQIVVAEPEGRRRMLDKIVFSVYPAYLNTIRSYQKLLRERNALLNSNINSADKRLLESWDEKLSQEATEVFLKRRELMDNLEPKIGRYYNEIAGEDAEVRVKYRASIIGEFLEKRDKEAIQEKYFNYWRGNIESDHRKGFTQRGPHTDDIVFYVKGRAVKETASQGQKRSLVIAQKLSELEIIKEKRGVVPSLLLDDVISELDAGRRAKLLAYLAAYKGQVIATTTDLGNLVPSELGEYTVYEVKKGCLVR
ncbi:MAG: DNA replication/repair protein RecF [Myxococcota bacterium]